MTTYYDPYPRQAAAQATSAYAPARPMREYPVPSAPASAPEPRSIRLDGLAVAALVIVAFLILQSVLDRKGGEEPSVALARGNQAANSDALTASEVTVSGQEAARTKEQELAPPPPVVADPYAISYPYDDFWITQGPHGYSYGHMAIDLAAGKGALVKSPIYGEVTAVYVDQYGNTTLVIENDVFVVTLLHGDFTAKVGQQVALGDIVGSESNNGYTTDMQGNSCHNRDCGYHSHLNVFSKLSQANVNPLNVLK